MPTASRQVSAPTFRSAGPVLLVCLCVLLASLWSVPARAAMSMTGRVSAVDHGKPLVEYFRESWTTRDGLPHNQVNAIAQTADGYLWLGTWEGLVRYNGLDFEVHDRRNTPELKDNGIRSVRVAPDGALVVGTARGGVTVVRRGQWTHIGREQGLPYADVVDALYDHKGQLWAATGNEGLFRLSGKKVQAIGEAQGMPSRAVNSLMLGDDGHVWAATMRGLARFRPDGTLVKTYSTGEGLPMAVTYRLWTSLDGAVHVATERGAYRLEGGRFSLISPEFAQDPVQSLVFDDDGTLWVGTANRGLVRQRGGHHEVLDTRLGLPNNRVSAMLRDREGSLWVGTNAGLMRLRDAPFTSINDQRGLNSSYVRSLLQTRDDDIWIGTSRGLHRWRDGRVVELFSRERGFESDSILSLYETPDRSVWVGTFDDGALQLREGRVVRRLDTQSGLLGTNQVKAITMTSDGAMWFGTSNGLVRERDGVLTRFDQARGLPSDFVIVLTAAPDGSLWVGTSKGIARIVGDRIEPLALTPAVDAENVFDIDVDAYGDLWIATDRGLVLRRAGRLYVVGLKQGLPIDTLFQIVDDQRGYLWLTSNRGVLRVARAQIDALSSGRRSHVDVDQFTEIDGLASAQCNGGSGPAALLDRSGRLWVATADGAGVVRPETVGRYSRSAPPVVLESVSADGVAIPLEMPIVLPAGTRRMEFRYAGMTFQMPKLLQYRQRMRGEDDDWIERGGQRAIEYTHLRPGHYRFEVQAYLPGEQGGDAARPLIVEVELEPFFWQRAWFMPALVLLVAAIAWSAYLLRVRALNHRAQMLENQVQQRTLALTEQTRRLEDANAEKAGLLERLGEQSQALHRQAREDPLTNLSNRREFDERITDEFRVARLSGRPLCVVLFDIDYFKRINDRYSHAAGDAAIQVIADILRAHSRGSDTIARWGGEEFVVLLPMTLRADAAAYAERVRRAVETHDCSDFAPGLQMTISGGVAEQSEVAHHEALITRADVRLYAAKHGGRNRIVWTDPSESGDSTGGGSMRDDPGQHSPQDPPRA